MMRHSVLVVFGAMLCVALAARAGLAETYYYTDGHADIGAGYENNQLHLHFHAEGATLNSVSRNGEFDVADVVTVVPQSTKNSRPAGSQWDFLGVSAGEDVYILPSSDQPGVPFLGLGTHDIEKESFLPDTITFALTGIVSRPAGGNFSLYEFDNFGAPVRLMDAADEAAIPTFANDSFQFPTFSHGHANYAFTVPGEYELEWSISGTPVGASQPIHDSGVLTFQVVPEPGTIALLLSGGAIGLAALALQRRRRTEA